MKVRHFVNRSGKRKSSCENLIESPKHLLSFREFELANKAFKESQNQDPSYLQGWVGQALLAELMGVDAESMDLFRHATFLGHELESSIGYANWVCK
jgi:hypothetical protein